MNKLESVYMIMSTDNETGDEHWLKSGRNCTPFTTTSIASARGELTRCKRHDWATYKLVKVSDVQDVI
jgi:hypothetical protein